MLFLVDEVWVLYTKSRNQPRNQGMEDTVNEVIGNIPFVKDGRLYPWSNLDPGTVHLIVSVMPDSYQLVEKNLITVEPPQQGPVFTHLLPRSYRATNNLHHFIMFLEAKVEAKVRVRGGWKYLQPPEQEMDGHDIGKVSRIILIFNLCR